VAASRIEVQVGNGLPLGIVAILKVAASPRAKGSRSNHNLVLPILNGVVVERGLPNIAGAARTTLRFSSRHD
jgi:hypothetical protein